MKKIFTISLIILLTTSVFAQWPFHNKPMLGQQINRAHPHGDPVGCWLFNEVSGNVAFDISGNSRNATFNNQTHFVTAHFGSGLEFDGNADNADTGWYPTAGSYTFSTWVKYISLASIDDYDEAVLAGCHDGGNDRIYFGIYQGFYLLGAGDSAEGTVAHSIVIDTWYHTAYTMDGSTARYYFNGVEVANMAYSWSGTSTVTLQFGDVNWGAGNRYLYGTLDHMIVWDYAKTASEIAELYSTPFCMFEADDVALMALPAPAVGGQVIIISSVIFEGMRVFAYLLILFGLIMGLRRKI